MNGSDEGFQGLLLEKLNLIEKEDDTTAVRFGDAPYRLKDIGEVIVEISGIRSADRGLAIKANGQRARWLDRQRERL